LSFNRNRYYAVYSGITDFNRALDIMETVTEPIEKQLKVFDNLVEKLNKGENPQQTDKELRELAEQETEIVLAKLPKEELEKVKFNEADMRALNIKEFIINTKNK